MLNARIAKTLSLAAFASLAIAAPASADSFVYLKGGDVWLTTTDAGRQFQVTQGGGYAAVSQADDGTILATTAGGTLRRLDRQGQTRTDITTPVTNAASGPFRFKGPYDADISPNGAKAAYGFLYTGYTNTTGGTYVNDGNATGFTRSDSATSIAEEGYKHSREYDAPEWVDDERVLVSNGPGWPSSPIAVVEAGGGNSRSWFTDPGNMHPHDATLSRNWRMLAATNGDRTRLHVYRDADALLLGEVYDCFFYSANPGTTVRYSSPTFSADGTVLAFANGHGIDIAPVGPATNGRCPEGVDSRDVLPGGSSPDWGPADVPTVRTVPFVTAGGDGGGVTPGDGSGRVGPKGPGAGGGKVVDGGGGPVGATLSLTATKVRLGKALRGGLPLALVAPGAGKVTVSVLVKGKVVASGRTTAKAAGPVMVTARFTPAARRKLARAAKVTLAITAAQGSATGSLTATLKR